MLYEVITGLSLEQVGADIASMVGGNYVNRFDIAGRSYKVIPQVQRIDRLNAEQLQNIYISGRNGGLIPLATVATLRNSTVPRSLNRFQQLNAVKLSGVAVRPLDEARITSYNVCYTKLLRASLAIRGPKRLVMRSRISTGLRCTTDILPKDKPRPSNTAEDRGGLCLEGRLGLVVVDGHDEGTVEDLLFRRLVV